MKLQKNNFLWDRRKKVVFGNLENITAGFRNRYYMPMHILRAHSNIVERKNFFRFKCRFSTALKNVLHWRSGSSPVPGWNVKKYSLLEDIVHPMVEIKNWQNCGFLKKLNITQNRFPIPIRVSCSKPNYNII